MNKIENKIKEIVKSSVNEVFDYQVDLADIVIEQPKNKEHGHYATNVAMRLVKQLKNKPVVLAQQLVDALNSNEYFEKVEIAGPGFINFFVKQQYIVEIINDVLSLKDDYGTVTTKHEDKINLEYVSVNPTGDLHPGHARGAAYGDSLARILTKAGYEVTREYYVNDAGNQIYNLALSIYTRYHQLFNIEIEMPNDGYHGDDIIQMASKLKEKYQDKFLNQPFEELEDFLREYGIEEELNKIKEDLDSFDVHFDVWTSERAIYKKGLIEEVLDKLVRQDLTYKAEDALWLKTTLFNDDKDRVLIKSDGTYTYLTPDIAYHQDKLNRGFNKLINVLGADHHSYVTRLTAAITALGYPEGTLDVEIVQLVRMIKDNEEFKLSKRSGKAVALRDLLDEAGKDAIRYFFASRALESQMDLDLDLAIKTSNENPVYYAQYAHARMHSILENAKSFSNTDRLDLLTNSKELELLILINDFTNCVVDAASARQPQKVCNYIQKLASSFHSFYNECKVIDYEQEELSKQRVKLVEATKTTLKNALLLVGVSAPDNM